MYVTLPLRNTLEMLINSNVFFVTYCNLMNYLFIFDQLLLCPHAE